MFYSAAVRQLFLRQTEKKKNVGTAGEWQLHPFPSSPHSISLSRASQARIKGAGLLSNFRDVKFTLGNVGFTQESHQRVVLEQTEITEGNEDEIGHGKKLRRSLCLKRVYHLISGRNQTLVG